MHQLLVCRIHAKQKNLLYIVIYKFWRLIYSACVCFSVDLCSLYAACVCRLWTVLKFKIIYSLQNTVIMQQQCQNLLEIRAYFVTFLNFKMPILLP